MSLRSTFNYFGRKVLYLWLKTEIIPNRIEQLDINPDLPVIYVLETRSWTNLLVLEEQCKRLGLEAPFKKNSNSRVKCLAFRLHNSTKRTF